MFEGDREKYREYIRILAKKAGCTIVGGSHHENVNGTIMIAGCVMNKEGVEIGAYSKLRPYFVELKKVTPGTRLCELDINGRKVIILICADFWYSDLLQSVLTIPDIILIPSLSVSRKPGPEYSRSLWKHLAISRAYEFGVYVGISDWNEKSVLPGYRTCGVGGFADPTQTDPDKLFTPISGEGISFFTPDFERLEAFREDRRMRGFYWKK